MSELGFSIFKDSTRAFFVEQIRALVAAGAEGVILGAYARTPRLLDRSISLTSPARTLAGCTEIELLVGQDDVPDVPLFPSAELHIEAAAGVPMLLVIAFSGSVDCSGGCRCCLDDTCHYTHGARCRCSGRGSESVRLCPTGRGATLNVNAEVVVVVVVVVCEWGGVWGGRLV